MATEGENSQGGFRLSNLIDLVFPRWKDVAISSSVTVQLPDDSMGKAMRYYRMWIYVSCIAIALPALIFAGVVAWIFSSDYFLLLPLYQYDWTFIYLYITIFIQIIPGPVVGSLGACKLNECLLWAYWGSMVILCLGDTVIGIVWAMKFTRLNTLLLEHLYNGLNDQYGSDFQFTQRWDYLQSTENCCGVQNATDYINTNWLKNLSSQITQVPLPPRTILPNSCCGLVEGIPPTCSWSTEELDLSKQGCYLILHTWMHKMGDILFVLGYSVIAFVRSALVFCLYSEIKHFIRKIYIRGVPREMHHASVSAGSDLANFHRNQGATRNSSLALHPSRSRDRSMRRWSFIRGLRGFRTGLQSRVRRTSAQNARPIVASNSTVKLKSINEENTTML